MFEEEKDLNPRDFVATRVINGRPVTVCWTTSGFSLTCPRKDSESMDGYVEAIIEALNQAIDNFK